MAATVDSVLSDLKNKKFAPVYFLQGEEPFYIDEIIDFIENNALSEADRAYNQVILYGKDVSVADILGHARGFSMFSDRKVVIVKEAQEIKGFDKEDSVKLLSSYLKNPQASTILAFAHKYKEIAKNKKIYKEIDQYAVCVSTKKMYENQVPDWVDKFVKSNGYKIAGNANALVCENVGVEISKLANELRKVFINIEKGQEISVDLVHKYVGISKDFNVFELQKTLVRKNLMKSIQIVQYFAANEKANPLVLILGNLTSYFIKVLQVHQSKGADLATVLKVNPFFVKDYQAAAQSFPLPKTLKIIHYLREADLQSKGFAGSMTTEDILKELVVKILA